MVFEQVDFTGVVKQLEQTGFYDVVLPFMLIFTIIFAILQKIKLFGEASKNINIVIAIITAFFVVRVPEITSTINMFLPKVSMLVLVLLMFLLILGIFGTKAEGWTGLPFFLAEIGAVIGIVWAITTSIPGWNMSLPGWLRLTPQDKAILLAVGIFVLILYLFREKKPEERGLKKWVEEFGPEKFGR